MNITAITIGAVFEQTVAAMASSRDVVMFDQPEAPANTRAAFCKPLPARAANAGG